MQLFFEKKDLKDNKLTLSTEKFHYLSRVKRIQKGEKIAIIIHQTHYTIIINKIDANYLYFNTLEKKPVIPKKLDITLIQCLPKYNKMDTIIDQVTQLGVSQIYPIESERSIVKWTQTKKEKQRQRWQMMSLRASQQSEQQQVPIIYPIQPIHEFYNEFKKTEYDYYIVPWESESKQTLKSYLKRIAIQKNYKIAVLIGPEGGISNSEINQLKTLKFNPLSLGAHIYKTEIAGLITISQLIYELS